MSLEAPAGAGIALDETDPGRRIHRFAHTAMATVFEVRCAHEDSRYARQAAHAAFEVLDVLELLLSRFVANSDVARINALSAGETTRVNPSTMECLEIARHMYDATRGAFDVSIGSGLARLDLDAEGLSVRAQADGVLLDLGGIGKGYAVDCMAELLEEWDVPRALVHGGFSSVVALEPPPGRDGWPLTLSSPGPADVAPEVLARLSARRIALSASGTRKGAHILDPRSGRAARDRAAWVALHPRGEAAPEPVSASAATRRAAAAAESFSTAFMILPVDEVGQVCRGWPGLEAWIVPDWRPGSAAPAVHLGPSPGASTGSESPTGPGSSGSRKEDAG